MYLLEIYVTNSALAIDHPFTYLCEEEPQRFERVEVSFANSRNVGLITGIAETEKSEEELEADYGYKLLWIERILDEQPVLTQDLFELAEWLSKTTISPLVACLNVMLPKYLKTDKNSGRPNEETLIRLHKPEGVKLTPKQEALYDSLHEDQPVSEARKISVSMTKALIDKGYIELYTRQKTFEKTFTEIRDSAFKQLTASQKDAYEQFLSSEKKTHYLFGVTGSGKTELYLHLTREYLKRKKQVLILVPEIALTPQMIERVKERFNNVAFYHSELNDQQRYEQYRRVADRETDIVVGTRSSVFLPFSDLGLIIMDEEHDSSYVQDNVPCYDARKAALKRALDFKADLLYASATPSLELYTRALKGEYQLLTLPDRINHTLPQIIPVDLNREVRRGYSPILSSLLKQEMQKALEQNKQTIILLNRRGYAPIIKCSSCKETLMCEDCDTALNYHNDERILKCHQCGRIYPMPKVCPHCGKNTLVYYGFGTKRVEEEIRYCFPAARVQRMDRDSTSRRGAHQSILERFARKEIDVLIGTQMIAKGLDYPDVTLVGILNADAGLMHQDYNSSKTTFDLLMQASGRSGRAADSGKVIIQAFDVDHYVIKAVLNQDYPSFYNTEMKYRYLSKYPPYTHFLALFLTDRSDTRLERSLALLEEKIAGLDIKHYRPLEVAKRAGERRFRILFTDVSLRKMLDALQPVVRGLSEKGNFSRIKVEIDPLYLE
ncbi:MAG: primosomal protein N' [Erysipelotrichaceae bacterium]|nr:primosomal protein N' [Erysipelotrichaceae bacterium]